MKIVRTNRQSNLRGSCQSIISLCRHHPLIGPISGATLSCHCSTSAPTEKNQIEIYGVPANQFSLCQHHPPEQQMNVVIPKISDDKSSLVVAGGSAHRQHAG